MQDIINSRFFAFEMRLSIYCPALLKCAARTTIALAVILLGLAANSPAHAAGIGVFENAVDIGENPLKGSSVYLADKAEYRITGSGANIWGSTDAFHFLWKRTSGDLVFSMNVAWAAESGAPHRKACAMVRQSLDPDSPYVDVAVHVMG